MSLRRRGVVVMGAAVTAASLLLAGCGGGSESDPEAASGGKVTIDWWHIGTTEPNKTIYDGWVKAYQAQHPNVTIQVTSLENDAFKSKMATVTTAASAPDIFSTWGGGVLKQQLDAGIIKDLSVDADAIGTFTPAALAAYQIDGKTYGIPVDVGMVGFWYNKKLFAEAGVTEPPATWSAFLDTVKKLKAAGTTPIALAGKEKWPGHYYWTYLAMRTAGLDALKQAATTHDFTGPGFVDAGRKLKELADLEPFQKGFANAAYSTPDGQAALVGGGKAGMELMGQWAPAVEKDAGGGIGEDLGFFPFPAVEGGQGAATEALGGGNGFAVGADAPAEAVDFLKFISQMENQKKFVESGAGLPSQTGAEEAIKDANLKTVATTLAGATGFQLYLDQAYPPAVGQEINDSVAGLIAGSKTPEEVAAAITETAKAEG
ncbi:ABC transporter substrate-binding protein [Planomonospora venezuelensis]|uniref:Raffinose/stachyose/melibiose transport system substrate-binding protein n=1 Tax=Planomonospora venezuelensis TaxID=1999 RepID=A0A841DEY8_PLAVE|nr:extracellular solute-binding protein [Planomonospora venezuelensis]MBB5966645.1 raffinose/stachyose/melibiose transport system substrate-binding protein [Planomonospora venezuelensis]GIN04340.1 sugar ABC transporter substrate-binding protein [Planomonospora venezuelensis]